MRMSQFITESSKEETMALFISNIEKFSIEDIRLFASKNLKSVGGGSSKDAYELPNDRVLKIARRSGSGFSNAGQTGAEIKAATSIDPEIIAKILDYDKKDGKWYIQEKASSISEAEFIDYYEVDTYSFGNIMKKRKSFGQLFLKCGTH